MSVPSNDKSLRLRTLVDHSIMETFSQGGKICITSRVYPVKAVNNQAHLYLFNNGSVPVSVRRMIAWELASTTIDVDVPACWAGWSGLLPLEVWVRVQPIVGLRPVYCLSTDLKKLNQLPPDRFKEVEPTAFGQFVPCVIFKNTCFVGYEGSHGYYAHSLVQFSINSSIRRLGFRQRKNNYN